MTTSHLVLDDSVCGLRLAPALAIPYFPTTPLKQRPCATSAAGKRAATGWHRLGSIGTGKKATPLRRFAPPRAILLISCRFVCAQRVPP
jgi:hypothetical protein